MEISQLSEIKNKFSKCLVISGKYRLTLVCCMFEFLNILNKLYSSLKAYLYNENNV